MTVTTGMLMAGKMSTVMCAMGPTPEDRDQQGETTNV